DYSCSTWDVSLNGRLF
nr:immunoglobulin light chain junction region [Macaca mulatta]MOW05605.1 immunoglobulin light chain junction region [Macaca mulatta]MOW06493.1 immunoglobulin light chain junction region [Macaca mulatta]MOW06606.1 immunoglobulin light chain junction region [Macaca mulatta]MOW06653.1 immunoglobulin light chain junction region [Macaca mulatta]